MTRPEAPRAPRFRPVLSPWRLAHSFFASLAPALGRYSPPLCRGNKMAAARARCARIRPPSRPLGRRRRLSRGVRAHRAPGRRLPRAGLCLLWRYARTRARAGSTHPPPAGSILTRAAGATPLPICPPLCPSPAPSSRRVAGSRGGKRRFLCPYVGQRGRPPPWNPVIIWTAKEASWGSQISGYLGLPQIRSQIWWRV